MITEEQVRAGLDNVLLPGVSRSASELNLIKDIAVSDKGVKITLASTALNTGTQDWLRGAIFEVITGLDGTVDKSVVFAEASPADLNKINNVIAVMSGKGGVGKSLVAGLTAVALKRRGNEVGILDADITGPSIPKMFGINERPSGNESGILPVAARSGIEVMSINLLLPGEEEAVIWRGPLIGRAITQFWEEVLWGKLDYLIIDLPPGTADAPLTVMQSLPVSGVIIVYTPQDLTAMIVKKAVKMVTQMGKPILGVVENMSYLYVPEIDKRIDLFGRSKGEEMARAAAAPLLGQLPIDPELARLCDEGNIELYQSEIIDRIGESLSKSAPVADKGDSRG